MSEDLTWTRFGMTENVNVDITMQLEVSLVVKHILLFDKPAIAGCCCVFVSFFHLHDTWRNSMGIPRTVVALAPMPV